MFRCVLLSAVLWGNALAADVLTVQDRASLGVHIAYALLKSNSPSPPPPPEPGPEPAPAPGETCDECGGVGKVGDGVVMLTCSACNGTGRKTSSPKPDKAVKTEPVAPRDGRTYRKVCRNGVCTWEPVP